MPLAIANHGEYQKIFAPLKAHAHLYSIGGQENVDELQKGMDVRIMIWWAIVLAQELVMTAFSPCSHPILCGQNLNILTGNQFYRRIGQVKR